MTKPTRRICTSIFIAMCVVLTMRTGAAAQPLVDLNGDGLGDAFIYNGYGNLWAMETTLPGGGFAHQAMGSFESSVRAIPANFNNDGLTDFFIWAPPPSQQWFKMLNIGASGFTVAGTGAWGWNFDPFVVDLNGDSVSDVFLWDRYSGVWFKCLSIPGGFTYTQGSWSTDWAVVPMRLNTDAMADFFISNMFTGQWFWVLGDAGPGFTYPQFAAWAPLVWSFHAGDFSGDGLTDLLLFNASNGQYFVATANPASGFTYVFGTFATGFGPYRLDLNADGRTDLFLYNGSTGQWFQMLSNGAGGLTVAGYGWFARNLWFFASDFNADGRGDLLILDPLVGSIGFPRWYQAINLSLGSFSFAASGFWNTSAIQTRMTGREGLFAPSAR